jgi:hypothetical protein
MAVCGASPESSRCSSRNRSVSLIALAALSTLLPCAMRKRSNARGDPPRIWTAGSLPVSFNEARSCSTSAGSGTNIVVRARDGRLPGTLRRPGRVGWSAPTELRSLCAVNLRSPPRSHKEDPLSHSCEDIVLPCVVCVLVLLCVVCVVWSFYVFM